MGLEADIIAQLNEQKASKSDTSEFNIALAAAPFVGLVNLPLALVIGVIGVAGAAAKEKKDFSEAVMPDEWLNSVAASSEVSPTGLAFLSKRIAKNGHITISDALKFVEIENDIEAAKKRSAYVAEAKQSSGAKAILLRAKKECGTLIDQKTIDSALELMNLGKTIVSSFVGALKGVGVFGASNDKPESYPEAICFVARAESVKCPVCQHINDSLLGDPRGKECECGGCGIRFKISAEAEPEIE